MPSCIIITFDVHNDKGDRTQHHLTSIRTHTHRYDHQERLTAKEAQAHPYFAPVREAEARAGGLGEAGLGAAAADKCAP